MSALGNKNLVDAITLYAIYDSKSESFSNIIPCENLEVFKRNLQVQITSQPNSVMAIYPTDFSVYRLGSWCKRTGYIEDDLTFECEVSEVLKNGGDV